MSRLARAGFWASGSVLAVSYLGWPVLTLVRAATRPRAPVATLSTGRNPTVSFVVAVHNEREAIARKVRDTLALRYPAGLLEVIIASDGSDDGTPDAARIDDPRVTVLDLARGGKNHAINRAVEVASHEILVFSDADSTLEPDALERLVAPFSDAVVGCVGGDFRYRRAAHAGGEGQRAYWRLERTLKGLQTRAGSATAVSGALLALRRDLFRPVPADTTDDFFIMAQALGARRRVVFEPTAVATGALALSLRTEFRRKRRIMTGGLRGVWHMRALLDPRRYGFTAVQLFLHKVLRRMAVFPLIALLGTSLVLAPRRRVYRLALGAQLALHLLAVTGYLKDRRGRRLSRAERIAVFYDMTNLAALIAVVNVLRGPEHCARLRSWSPDRAGEAPDPAPAHPSGSAPATTSRGDNERGTISPRPADGHRHQGGSAS